MRLTSLALAFSRPEEGEGGKKKEK